MRSVYLQSNVLQGAINFLYLLGIWLHVMLTSMRWMDIQIRVQMTKYLKSLTYGEF